MNFKRCSTAAALLMATALPAFAQTAEVAEVEVGDVTTLALPDNFVTPEGSVVLQFEDRNELFVVPYATAAALCEVSEGDFATIAESDVDVIYCEQIEEEVFTTFTGTEGVTSLERGEDDDDDDGDDSDDAEETAEDEANDEQSGDGILDEDDNDQDDDDGLIDDDDAGTDDDQPGEDDEEDATDDTPDADNGDDSDDDSE